ncbi:hypothetical protein Nmel_003704 [Mimus melanotis]
MQSLHLCRTLCSCYSGCHADGMVGTCDGKYAKGKTLVCKGPDIFI